MGLKFLYPALLFAGMLTAGSCTLSEGPDFGKGTVTLIPPKTAVQGSVVQTNASGISRALISDAARAGLVYELTLTCPGESLVLEMGMTGVTISLDAGQWTVTAVARDPGSPGVTVGSGSTVITVIAGQSSSVKIPMRLTSAYEDLLTEIWIHNEEDLRRVGTDFDIDGSFITTFYLERDIVVNQPWTPVGDDGNNSFKAIFDGQGHTITINSFAHPQTSSGTSLLLGFFGGTGDTVPGVVIKNLTIRYRLGGAVEIGGYNSTVPAYAGGVTGRAANTRLENVKVEGNFSVTRSDAAGASLSVGGIAGYADTSATEIIGCHVSGEVKGTTPSAPLSVGGIVGMANISDNIQAASFTGKISAAITSGTTQPCYAGGIAGRMENGQIISCYASAVIDARGPDQAFVGGIAGQLTSTVSGQGVITACYTWVQIKADGTDTNYAGGIAGQTDSQSTTVFASISGSYARGRVEAVFATIESAGGIIGFHKGEIESCIALNDDIVISIASSDARGIAGTAPFSPAVLSNNYAASDINFDRSASTPSITGLDGIPSARTNFIGQANQANYPIAFWNFAPNGDWKWISGYDYPVLAWQTTAPRDPATL